MKHLVIKYIKVVNKYYIISEVVVIEEEVSINLNKQVLYSISFIRFNNLGCGQPYICCRHMMTFMDFMVDPRHASLIKPQYFWLLIGRMSL